MLRGQVLTAIDWGATKICVLVARIDPMRGPLVTGVSVEPSKGFVNGAVEDAQEASVALAEAIYKAEYRSGAKIEDALLTISSGDISSINNQATLNLGELEVKVTQREISRVLELVANPASGHDSSRVLQVIPSSYSLDGKKSVRDPMDMRCSKLQVNAHLILGSRWKVRSVTRVLETLGIKPLGLVLAPIASGEAVLTSAEKQVGVALMEIGGAATNVVIYQGGAPTYTFPIPVGGYHFTNDLVFGLGLPYEVAEVVKLAGGSANAELVPRDQRISLEDLGIDDKRSIRYREVCDILRERAVELFRLLIYKLREIDKVNKVPAGVVLTGGSAKLHWLDSLGTEMLKILVRVGNPETLPGLPSTLIASDYTAPVGLLYWGLDHYQLAVKEAGLLGLNGHRRPTQGTYEKVFSWFKDLTSRSKSLGRGSPDLNLAAKANTKKEE